MNRRRTCRPRRKELGERLRTAAASRPASSPFDGKLEVFEQVYELASQRINDFRTACKETMLEWIIVVVLIAESLLMLGEILFRLERSSRLSGAPPGRRERLRNGRE